MATSRSTDQLTLSKHNLNKPYLDTREFAAFLNCAPYTVRRSRSTGKLLGKKAPKYKKRGRSIVYPTEVALAFDEQFELQENTAQNETNLSATGVVE